MIVSTSVSLEYLVPDVIQLFVVFKRSKFDVLDDFVEVTIVDISDRFSLFVFENQ